MPVHHREVCRPYVLFLYMLPRIKDISKKKNKPAFFHNWSKSAVLGNMALNPASLLWLRLNLTRYSGNGASRQQWKGGHELWLTVLLSPFSRGDMVIFSGTTAESTIISARHHLAINICNTTV